MPARPGQQNLSNWLILIPLTIVPALAVFGVPEFEALSADDTSAAAPPPPEMNLGSAMGESSDLPPLLGGEVRMHEAQAKDPPAETGWDDPFQNPGSIHSVSQTSTSAAATNSGIISNANAAPARELRPASPQLGTARELPRSFSNGELKAYSRSVTGSETSRAAIANEAKAALSWQQAVRKLNELGVHEYQLAQTEEPFTFRFSCDYTPSNNPRITRRFEAEAGEPLRAVEQVIGQVEQWLNNPTQ